MGWLSAIIAFLNNLFKAIPIIERLLTKTTQSKIDDKVSKIDKEEEEVDRTGRPPKK